MFEKISRFMTDYKVQKTRINHHVSFKDTSLATLNAIIVTLVLLAIPVLLVYNLMIFSNINWLLYTIIFILVIGFPFLYLSIYIKILKNNYSVIQNYKFNALVIVEASTMAIILVVFTAIIIALF